MSTEHNDQQECDGTIYTVTTVSPHRLQIIMPLQMEWQPKEDITVHELALCVPYLVRHTGVMPYEVDCNDAHFRHFKITDHN